MNTHDDDDNGKLHPLSVDLATTAKTYPRQQGTRYLVAALKANEESQHDFSSAKKEIKERSQVKSTSLLSQKSDLTEPTRAVLSAPRRQTWPPKEDLFDSMAVSAPYSSEDRLLTRFLEDTSASAASEIDYKQKKYKPTKEESMVQRKDIPKRDIRKSEKTLGKKEKPHIRRQINIFQRKNIQSPTGSLEDNQNGQYKLKGKLIDIKIEVEPTKGSKSLTLQRENQEETNVYYIEKEYADPNRGISQNYYAQDENGSYQNIEEQSVKTKADTQQRRRTEPYSDTQETKGKQALPSTKTMHHKPKDQRENKVYHDQEELVQDETSMKVLTEIQRKKGTPAKEPKKKGKVDKKKQKTFDIESLGKDILDFLDSDDSDEDTKKQSVLHTSKISEEAELPDSDDEVKDEYYHKNNSLMDTGLSESEVEEYEDRAEQETIGEDHLQAEEYIPTQVSNNQDNEQETEFEEKETNTIEDVNVQSQIIEALDNELMNSNNSEEEYKENLSVVINDDEAIEMHEGRKGGISPSKTVSELPHGNDNNESPEKYIPPETLATSVQNEALEANELADKDQYEVHTDEENAMDEYDEEERTESVNSEHNSNESGGYSGNDEASGDENEYE